MKQRKMKINVRSVMRSKVGEMGEKARVGRSRSLIREVVGCFQAIVGGNKFQV